MFTESPWTPNTLLGEGTYQLLFSYKCMDVFVLVGTVVLAAFFFGDNTSFFR
jgi:hypothetical protein